ncbi:MAG: PQQ-dependent sugar dehydrogenase [Acidobacteriota bacterium]
MSNRFVSFTDCLARRPFAAALIFGLSFGLVATAEARRLELDVVDEGIIYAVAITHAGDDRLFVVSKEGQVWLYRNGVQDSTPFLDIRDRVLFTGELESEQGLLTIAFHPNFQQNGFVFAAYTDRDGVGVLSRFSVTGPDPDQATRGSERVLLRVNQPGPNHNLNHLAFGPDGYLYLSSGDGGYQPEPRCTPQERDNLLGKILRLDVDRNVDTAPYHAIPPNNPFVNDPGTLDEIWALGLRNPWRFTFDRGTGDLFIADVGHKLRDEINFVSAGGGGGLNYGFKMMEGFACRGSDANCSDPIPGCNDPAYTSPILDNALVGNQCAVIGGYVYRGNRIPALRGTYLVGDYCGATGLITRSGSTWRREALSTELPGLVAFGEDRDGEIYLLVSGDLYSLRDVVDDSSVAFADPAPRVSEGAGVATVQVRRSGGTDGQLSVNWRAEAQTATGADFVAASGTLVWPAGTDGDQSFNVTVLDDAEAEGNETVRLVLENAVGGSLGSPSQATLTIVDNDLGVGSCVPSETVLCLHDGRFRVTVDWREFTNLTGPGRSAPLDLGDSGLFWFFSDTNMEMLVKVLNGCGFNDRYWVFAAGTTDVEWTLRVVDTQTGALRVYSNPLGQPSAATTDTDAFVACP